MAQTWDSRRLRHERAMDRRLTAEHRNLARVIAAIVLRAAGPDGIVPNRRIVRSDLSETIWSQAVKLYYIGTGDNPFRDARPRSPYAQLLFEGIAGSIRIQVERQVAIARRVIRDPEVIRWLTGSRPQIPVREIAGTVTGRITELNSIRFGEDPIISRTLAGSLFPGDLDRLVRPRGRYDAFHRFVDPNGYRLSDRVWQTSINVRSNVDGLLDYHIGQGTSAVDIAELLEDYLTPGAGRIRTRTPYGVEGSYAARRLARTEITANAGRATIAAADANPSVQWVQWRLSASHRESDQCDINANGGPNGDGTYPPDQVPRYPDHPNEMCSLVPVPRGSTSDLVQTLRDDIRAARGELLSAVGAGGNAQRARRLQGLLNPDYLTSAIMHGTLEDAVLAAVRQVTGL